MRAAGVVAGHELVHIPLELTDGRIESLPPLHPEVLVEQGAVHPFDEAIDARTPYFGVPVRDILDGREQPMWMRLRRAAELAAVVREDRCTGSPGAS